MRHPHPTVRVLLCLAFAGAALGLSPAADAARPAGPPPPTFTVNSAGDAVGEAPLTDGICATHYDSGVPNGNCTLRAAVMEANHTLGGGATINIPAGVYLLGISRSGGSGEAYGDLNLQADVTIAGAGADVTILDGNGLDRLFQVDPGVTASISDATLRNGHTPDYGGSIHSQGNLTLNGVVVSDNIGNSGGGGLHVAAGKLTLDHSLVTGNHAAAGSGGGLLALSETHILNSTISNNTASGDDTIMGYGGGLFVGGSVLDLYFSTVAGNLVDASDALIGTGGGLYNFFGTVNLRGSLLADNVVGQSPQDCAGAALNSLGYNLLSTSADCTLDGDPTGNQADIDLLLEPLRDNGGPALTRGLLAGSPAGDAVPPDQCLDRFAAPLAADQRGFARPDGADCDIGAFEGQRSVGFYNRNLIHNGDAESAAGTTFADAVGAPQWSNPLAFSTTVAVYGAISNLPLPTDPGPLDRGQNFFAGGPANQQSDWVQSVDVSPISGAIDAGQVEYDLSGYFGGVDAQGDYAALAATFYSGVTPIGIYPIGYVTPANRGNQTGLLFRSGTGAVPAGTTSIEVLVDFVRVPGSTYNDGYADNLSLVLRLKALYLPLVRR